MNQHRLVILPSVVKQDYDSTRELPTDKQLSYQLFHQMTRITKDRGSLRHDDRLDALAIAVTYWVEQVSSDVEMNIKARHDALFDKEMDDFDRSWNKQHKSKERQGWIR
jgi:hypothetical protein